MKSKVPSESASQSKEKRNRPLKRRTKQLETKVPKAGNVSLQSKKEPHPTDVFASIASSEKLSFGQVALMCAVLFQALCVFGLLVVELWAL